MSMLIPLTKGQFAIVDDADFDWLSQWKWLCKVMGRNMYASRPLDDTLMHRLIMDTPDGLFTDHRNHDGLNNQRRNLRICTRVENCRNTGPRGQFKGVHRERHRWRASITVNRKHIYLGIFATPEEAARVYDKNARVLFGDFAYLNFPQEQQP